MKHFVRLNLIFQSEIMTLFNLTGALNIIYLFVLVFVGRTFQLKV